MGKRLAALPEAGIVLYPGHEDIPELPLGAKDTEIFAEVGAGRRDLLFITRDKKIRTRPVERRKLRDARVRAVILTGRSNMTQDAIYRLILKYWDELAQSNYEAGHVSSPSRHEASGRCPCSAGLTTARILCSSSRHGSAVTAGHFVLAQTPSPLWLGLPPN